MKNKITRVFLETDMRCQHDGLALVASSKRVKISELGSGEHLIFINKARNKLKMVSSTEIVSYLKSKTRLDLNAVGKIPAMFTGDVKVAYSKALKERLEKGLARRV